jgi:hypothetical protein
MFYMSRYTEICYRDRGLVFYFSFCYDLLERSNAFSPLRWAVVASFYPSQLIILLNYHSMLYTFAADTASLFKSRNEINMNTHLLLAREIFRIRIQYLYVMTSTSYHFKR